MRRRRSFRPGLIILFFLLIPTASQWCRGQEHPDVDSLYRRIVRLYEEGSYLSAEVEGRRLLEQGEINDRIRIQLEQTIAFSLIAQDRPQSASAHFLTILQADSTYDLDPQLTSPKILSIFRQARERFLAGPVQVPGNLRTRTASSPVTFRTVVFPGWEQLYQGRKISGIAFLSVGAASALATLYYDIQRRSARDSYLQAASSDVAVSRYSDYNRYYKGEVYSAALFAATYVLSELEVFVVGSDETPISARLMLQNDHTIASLHIRF
jgi:hypothetical protein